MKKTDDELIKLLQSHPEYGMEQLIEQYTGLVWTIAADQLNNVEDVKECVNDTFADFYRQRDRFDMTKGTLSSYLGAIAKNRAISKYHKNKMQTFQDPLEESIRSDFHNQMDAVEWKVVLEQAMTVLSSEDLKIVRMKYYENLTVKEIAEALNIPYETAKKRHQRSIGKMKKALIALLVLALVTLLTACAYIILRYFGVVPGYGINTNEETGIYTLEKPVSAENSNLLLQIEEATLINSELVITMREIEKSADYFGMYDDDELYYNDETYNTNIISTGLSDTEELLRLSYSNLPMPDKHEERITVNLSYAEIPLSFTLVQAEEFPATQYSFDIVNDTGLLAIPRRENGELIVSIHPLNSGEATIMPSLVESVYTEFDTDTAPITLTDAEGNIYTGTCVGYSPVNPALFFDWNFGAVPAGDYTLHVPYVYEKLKLPDDFVVPVDLINGVDTKTIYEFENFSFQIVSCNKISVDEIPSSGETTVFYDDSEEFWIVNCKATFHDADRYLVGANLNLNMQHGSGSLRTITSTEEDCISLLVSLYKKDIDKVTDLYFEPSQGWLGPYLGRRWNQEFHIDISVED